MGKNNQRRHRANQITPQQIWNRVLNWQEQDFQELEQLVRITGRNDPCWCGSQKKFKHCHLSREQETPVRIHDYIKVMRKLHEKGYCLHPKANQTVCVGPIVRAHTVQRNGGLSRIARDGHVYTFLSGDRIADNQLVTPSLVGIKKASTFTGFCSWHDNQTFEPIEHFPFQSTPQHTFLLGYRALSHELYKKKAAIDLTFPYQLQHLDKGRSLSQQINTQHLLHTLIASYRIGLRDLVHYKTAYDQALLASNFSEANYYVLRLDKTPEFLCASPLAPDFDFAGELLQDPMNISLVLDHLVFSMIATDSGGAVIFSWLGQSKAAVQLVKSLDVLSDKELPHAIVRFAFEYFENIFASPIWWESLDTTAQQHLLKRQASGLPSTGKAVDCLTDDGLRVVKRLV